MKVFNMNIFGNRGDEVAAQSKFLHEFQESI